MPRQQKLSQRHTAIPQRYTALSNQPYQAEIYNPTKQRYMALRRTGQSQRKPPRSVKRRYVTKTPEVTKAPEVTRHTRCQSFCPTFLCKIFWHAFLAADPLGSLVSPLGFPPTPPHAHKSTCHIQCHTKLTLLS